LHYVAVNARTKETMGSVPIHMPKLIICSILVEILGIIAMLYVDSDYSFLFLLLGFIFYFMFYSKYRNKNARHTHEKDTVAKIENISQYDNYVERRKRLRNSNIDGANNNNVSNQSTDMMKKILSQNSIKFK